MVNGLNKENLNLNLLYDHPQNHIGVVVYEGWSLVRDSYTNRNHCPSHEMWSYERDGRWWSFVRGSTIPCNIFMYLAYCNSYSRQAVLTVHVLYCKINLSIYQSIYLSILCQQNEDNNRRLPPYCNQKPRDSLW